MRKGAILFFYAVALFFVLRRWYQGGNSGLPDPQVLAAPTYLYGIAAITSDFLGPLPVVVAAGMTVVLIEQVRNNPLPPSQTGPQYPTSPITGTSPNNPTGKSSNAPAPGPSGSPITGNIWTPGPRINPYTGKPYTTASA